MENAIGLIVAAILIESIVNVVESAVSLYKSPQFWGSIVVGLLVALVYGLDLFELVGFEAAVPYVGVVLTGLVISRGANYLSDLLSKIQVLGT